MTDVAVVGFAQSPVRVREDATTGGVEMLVPIFAEVYAATGLTKADIGFWCSGSSDYLAGRAFSFVQAVDAIGAVPPIMESHVEMDGAWALYEAWVKIMSGEAEIALAYGFGKSSGAELRRVLALQLDPYLVAPLWPDAVSVAALQARLGHRGRALDREGHGGGRGALPGRRGRQPGGAGVRRCPDRGPARPALRGRPAAGARLRAGRRRRRGRHPRVRRAGARAVRPPGLDHVVRAPDPVRLARGTGPAERRPRAARLPPGVRSTWPNCTRRSPIRRSCCAGALGGPGDGGLVEVNPSGGALCGNPMFAAGLARIGCAAEAIMSGRASASLGHATSGPALQQNLVCVMEAR